MIIVFLTKKVIIVTYFFTESLLLLYNLNFQHNTLMLLIILSVLKCKSSYRNICSKL